MKTVNQHSTVLQCDDKEKKNKETNK